MHDSLAVGTAWLASQLEATGSEHSMGIFDDAGGTPAVSWKGVRKGTKISGVVLPTESGKGYDEVQQRDYDTNDLLTYDNGDPRMQAVILLQTEHRGWEFTSESFSDKAADDPDMTDEGLRREFVYGKNAVAGVKQALRKIKAKDIMPGMVWTREYAGTEPVPGGGKKTANVWNITIDVPTPASQAVVAAYIASKSEGGSLSTGGDDTGRNDGADEPAGDDEPPF